MTARDVANRIKRALIRQQPGSTATPVETPAPWQHWTTHTVHHPRPTICGECGVPMFVGRGLHPFKLPPAGQERIRGALLCDPCARRESPADFDQLAEWRAAR